MTGTLKNALITIAAFAGFTFAAPALAAPTLGVSVGLAVPTHRVVVARPTVASTWVPGHFKIDMIGRRVWIDGHWRQPVTRRVVVTRPAPVVVTRKVVKRPTHRTVVVRH